MNENWVTLFDLGSHGAVDLADSESVLAELKTVYAEMFGNESQPFVEEIFAMVLRMFCGDYEGFQAMDTRYHNLAHTLLTSLCLTWLLRGHLASGDPPPLGIEDAKLGFTAILLHDIGYLKEESDRDGTGAKYTHIHEQRSCIHARSTLRELGWPDDAIYRVETLIRCTGPNSKLEEIPFKTDVDVHLGRCVCTADFVGQMSDPAYPDKLRILFEEFEENFRYRQLPPERWPFSDYEDLLKKTPGFWSGFVVPRMENDCLGVWKYLCHPQTGENPFRRQIDANLVEIQNRIRLLRD